MASALETCRAEFANRQRCSPAAKPVQRGLSESELISTRDAVWDGRCGVPEQGLSLQSIGRLSNALPALHPQCVAGK